MSSDNQFTALGPTIIGFQTNGTNIDRGAEISGKAVGIKGNCMGPSGDGVQGTGSGTGSGVQGNGGSGNGVTGESKQADGVKGHSVEGNGVHGASDNSIGVLGEFPGNKPPPVKHPEVIDGAGVVGKGPRAGVWGRATHNASAALGGQGVRGEDVSLSGSGESGTGVFGASRIGVGVLGRSSIPDADLPKPIGGNLDVYDVSLTLQYPPGWSPPRVVSFNNLWNRLVVGTPIKAGVAGIGGSREPKNNDDSSNQFPRNCVGVYGEAPSQLIRGAGDRPPIQDFLGLAGLFYGPTVLDGPTFVFGDFFVVGANNVKGAVVPHPDGSHRALYCMESPESWFEDFGEAALVKGKARVQVDADFAHVVDIRQYHVFLTPYGDSEGLFVAKRNKTGFEVREQRDGTSNIAFSYRIVAKRKDVTAERLAVINVPAKGRLNVPAKGRKST